MSEVLEVAVFTVKPGERDAFLREREPALAALAQRFGGMLEARLAEYDDGTWIDVIRWRNLPAAKAAVEGMPEVEEARIWASHIDEVRDFRHASLHHLLDAAVH